MSGPPRRLRRTSTGLTNRATAPRVIRTHELRSREESSGLSLAVMERLASQSDDTRKETRLVLGTLRDRFSFRKEFRPLFRLIDLDKSGKVDREELGVFLRKLSMDEVSEEAIDNVMIQLDPDGDGISLAEMCNNLLRAGAIGTYDPFAASIADRSDAHRAASSSYLRAAHAERARLRARREALGISGGLASSATVGSLVRAKGRARRAHMPLHSRGEGT